MKNLLIKKLDSKTLLDQVQKMLQHFERNNFVRLDANKSVQSGYNGELMKQHIKNEWMLSNVVLSDEPAFQFDRLKNDLEFKSAFTSVRELVSSLPFSFVEIFKTNVNWESDSKNKEENQVEKYFEMDKGVLMKKQILCSPDTSITFFHKQQRERKIWWRKFSALPGRFCMTSIHNNEADNSQFVKIQAEFPWGLETIEIIKYLPEMLNYDTNFYEMKEQRKKFIPHVISSEIILEKCLLTYLCDAYDGINEETDREMLRFHRKLAPYKISFAGSASTSEINHSLKDLALVLSRKIRKTGISVLLLPDMCKTSLESQILRNDALGIPYTIVLNEKTLKDGIIGIRSRDTTLKEQSHVSLIVSYVELLMKNY